MASLRIRNATILTQDDMRRVVQGDLFVEDGRITHVGGPGAKREADTDIDGTGQVVLPGLVNLHTHLAMGLFRGYGDDMPLEAWLQTRIWPAEDRMTAADMKAGADLGIAELLRFGTTSFLDMYWMQEDVVAPACRAAGIRAWLGEGMVDTVKTPKGQPNAKLPAIERFVKATEDDPLITACPAPHATYTCNGETYAESARIALEHGVPLHTHCSETRTEVYDVQGRTGKRPVANLQLFGALTPHTVLAHCGWITKGEVADIAQGRSSVAHCPVSNMKLATGGVTPVPELQAAGVRVGLGTDGAASNNTLDLLETIKFAALAQKQHRWDATALPAQRALDMATRDGADALHRPDLGRVVEGATADLCMLDFRQPHLSPRHDPVSDVAYSASGRDVGATIVGGRLLYHGGAYTTLDVGAVLQAAEQAARRVTAQQSR
jgi:5-methylthioadenosine/S-adenosylhomocysteine deaminase